MVCLVLFALSREAAAAGAGSAPQPLMPPFGPALAAGGGAVASAVVAWSVARPLGNVYVRAALAMMGIMGTALVAAATLPVDILLGRLGLALLGGVCVVAIPVARRTLLEPRG